MKKILGLGLFVGLMALVFGVGIKPARAWTCDLYDPWGGCIINHPSSPPTMSDCGSDTTCHPGETLFFTSTNGNGWCTRMPAGGSWNIPNMGNYDNSINSIKNCSGRLLNIYLDANYGGPPPGGVGDQGNTAQNMNAMFSSSISSVWRR